MGKPFNLSIRSAAVALLCTAAVACTFITNESATQCRSQQDCISRGPEFADTTCNTDRVCEKVVFSDRSCTKNQECIERAGGAPAICRKSDSQCVKLQSNDCQAVYAEQSVLLDDNSVFVGATVPNVEVGFLADFAAQLARKEINRAGGLPPATPGGPRRPLGLVMCRGDNTTVSIAKAQYRHLSDVVQVPAVLASITSARWADASNQFIASNVLQLSPNSQPEISDLSDNDLVFRLGFSEAMLARSLTGLLQTLQPTMIADGMLGADEVPRVAVLRDLGEGVGLTAAIAKTLKIKDVPVGDPSRADNFRIFDLSDALNPVDHPNPDAEKAAAIQAAIKFRPHLVVISGAVTSFSSTYPTLERAWPVGVPRPYTVATLPALSGTVVTLAQQLNNEEARKKNIGIRAFPFDYSADDLALFAQNLRTEFPEATQQLSVAVWAYYDAMYMFSYAASAIGSAPLRGAELSKGIRRVSGASGGVPIKWGPADFAKGVSTVAAGNNLSYVGVTGTYGFDQIGDHLGFVDVYCVPLKGGRPSAVISSGLKYDPKSDTFSGAYACPDQ